MSETTPTNEGLKFTDAAARKVGELVGVHVIPNPDGAVETVFPIK